MPTTAYVTITNGRLIQERWASLLAIVDQILAPAGDDGITIRTGPHTSQATALEQSANWLVTLPTRRVLALQTRLTRIATAYPHVEVLWSETTARRLMPDACATT